MGKYTPLADFLNIKQGEGTRTRWTGGGDPQHYRDLGVTPDAIAKAMANGSATRPTVNPAIKSCVNCRGV